MARIKTAYQPQTSPTLNVDRLMQALSEIFSARYEDQGIEIIWTATPKNGTPAKSKRRKCAS